MPGVRLPPLQRHKRVRDEGRQEEGVGMSAGGAEGAAAGGAAQAAKRAKGAAVPAGMVNEE